MRSPAFYLLCTTLVFSSLPIAAAEVYKWVDENGLTHYGAQPPKNTKASKIKTQTGHSEPVSYNAQTAKAEADTNVEAETPQTTPPARFKDPERCASAKKSLSTLQTYARVRTQGEDGEVRILTPKEHSQKMAEAKKAIEESC